MGTPTLDRRTVLATTGTALAAGLAGCTGNGGGNGDGGDTATGTDTATATATGDGDTASGQARAVEYLNAEPKARNFDGSVTDVTGQGSVTIEVGVGADNFAFGPAAVTITAGTTVTWKWTGKGGKHNVVSTTPDTYASGDFSSDFEFDSGSPKASGSFEQTFESSGVGLYRCEPHQSIGMKGAIIVVAG